MKLKLHTSILASIGIMIALTGCYREKSGATGWKYMDKKNGWVEKWPYDEQQTGPGLIFIEGGTFTMGQVEDDLTNAWDNSPRRVTVSSFYMDETEVTNMYWNEYLNWLNRVYGEDYYEVVERALPDTLAWREKLAYNEPMVKYYLRHPAYREYPVVGVSWRQANDFCKWRTDRVNENILVQEGILEYNLIEDFEGEHFTTETYFNGQYNTNNRLKDDHLPMKDWSLNSLRQIKEYRDVRMEDGLLLPDYRLPTEAEWEYAALGLIGNSNGELIDQRRTYPWDGHFIRNENKRDKGYGEINANFVRGRGDYMGVAGALNDFGDITVQSYAYAANDYGLYNMAGNVNEWVMDVYRPLSTLDADEFRPFRGNKYQTYVRDGEGNPKDKYDYVVYDVFRIKKLLSKYINSKGEENMHDAEVKLLNGDPKAEVSNEQGNDNKKKDDVPRFTAKEGVVDIINEMATYLKEQNAPMDSEAVQTEIDVAVKRIRANQSPIASDLMNIFSECIVAVQGDMKVRDVTVEENIGRKNYREADNIDYLDGDRNSSIEEWLAEEEGEGEGEGEGEQGGDLMYDYLGSTTSNPTSLVNNESRVYKGGGWDDRAYWLVPGTRRFLDETESSASIGFRCAMTRLGTPVPYDGH